LSSALPFALSLDLLTERLAGRRETCLFALLAVTAVAISEAHDYSTSFLVAASPA
jgi:hypothetical protein